jgi:hypothetical protein
MKRKTQRVHTGRELPVVAASPSEIAQMYGISRDLIYKYLRSGALLELSAEDERVIEFAPKDQPKSPQRRG